jgi:hypothetical protein
MSYQSEHPTLRLSAGEMACVLGLRHAEQHGLELLKMQLGILDEDEARLVMNTSSHSLLARRLLSVDEELNLTLDSEMETAVRLFVESNWMIQCNREAGDDVTFLSFHLGEGGIVRQSTVDEVVHELEILPDFQHVIAAAQTFYEAPPDEPDGFPPVELLSLVVEEIRDSQNTAFIQQRLTQSGVPEHARDALTEDFLNTRFRGSVVRVDHHESGTSVSQHSFFILRGATRFWLLHPKVSGANQVVEVSLGSKKTFGVALSRVIKEPSPLPSE